MSQLFVRVHCAIARWNNYYIAGLRQVMRDYNASGIYLDEIAYDRTTMLRARKVLGDSGKIDHHAHISAFSASSATNYMELYPFINRLWYGEGFDYDTPRPDNWLIETAAHETGLSSDMLRYTSMGHTHGMTRYAYRGMLVGSAFRYTGGGPFDPTALWSLWDAFDIQSSEMIGWWEDVENGAGTVPVRATASSASSKRSPAAAAAAFVRDAGPISSSASCSGGSDSGGNGGDGNDGAVKVTVYLKKGVAAMIVVADWDEYSASVTFCLDYDWTALGLNPATATLTAPSLPPFQTAAAVVGNFTTSHSFTIAIDQGGVILLLQ